MRRIDPTSRLVANEVTIEFESQGNVTLKRGGNALSVSPVALRVLEAFAAPVVYSDAVSRLLASSTKAGFITMTALIAELFDQGFLGETGSAPMSGRFHGEVGMHIAMLNDRARTQAYLDAIARIVRPGDVVIDLGTGTGVLAMAAARAGASRVYAIEASSFADTAEKTVADNGYADVVQIVRGWSTEIDLPERADVLLSEIIGNDPFAEGFLLYLSDARRRFLKPDGILLPDRFALGGYFASASTSAVSERRVVTHDAVRWQQVYGMDFSEFADLTRRTTMRLYLPPSVSSTWPMCSPARLLWEHCFAHDPEVQSLSFDWQIADEVEHPAFVWYFELGFGTQTLSTDPRVDSTSHWKLPVDLPPAASRYRLDLRTSAVAQKLLSEFKVLSP